MGCADYDKPWRANFAADVDAGSVEHERGDDSVVRLGSPGPQSAGPGAPRSFCKSSSSGLKPTVILGVCSTTKVVP